MPTPKRQTKYKNRPRVDMTPLGKRALIQPGTPRSGQVVTGRLIGWTSEGDIRVCRDFHKSVDTYHHSFWKVR